MGFSRKQSLTMTSKVLMIALFANSLKRFVLNKRHQIDTFNGQKGDIGFKNRKFNGFS
tara:strand:+ start:967 stop:1140 length:174 start_codon:yes stop_codon:yes gene_type:complete